MKPICFLFLSVTRINPCLKQQRYQKGLQMTHSSDEGCLTAGFVSFWVVRRSFNLVVFSQESVILIALHVVQCFLELLSIR